MQVSDLTTAADIIAKFNWRRQNSVKEADVQDLARLKISKSNRKDKKKENVQFVLCESGGNIGKWVILLLDRISNKVRAFKAKA